MMNVEKMSAAGEARKAVMAERIVRKVELLRMLGISDATLYRMEKAGRFPRRIELGGGQAVGWISTEIDAWLEQKKAERGSK